jgi:hypothetical protein
MARFFKQIVISTFLVVVFVCFGKGVYAGNIETESDAEIFSKISFSNPSYITLRGGIGNIEKLMYEVNFAPDFKIDVKRFPGLRLEFTPWIILRMYDAYSHPVRTPSYMPMGTVYYHLPKNLGSYGMTPFLTFGHHSNGQDGQFFNSDSTFNKVDGSFSSNYGTLGLGFTNVDRSYLFNPVTSAKFSFTYYRLVEWYLKEYYGKMRFFADVESNLYLSKERMDIFKNHKSRSQLISNVHVGWIAADLMNAKAVDMKRLIFSWTVSYQPSFFSDVAFFGRYYYGQDYYNINFDRTLSLFQVGLSIRDFNF